METTTTDLCESLLATRQGMARLRRLTECFRTAVKLAYTADGRLRKAGERPEYDARMEALRLRWGPELFELVSEHYEDVRVAARQDEEDRRLGY